jgi:hypothetical protein
VAGLSKLESATLLNLLIDHLRTGATGYAGLFDAVKVKEPELDRVYQFDTALGAGVRKLKGIIDQISTMASQGTDPVPSSINWSPRAKTSTGSGTTAWMR